MINAPDAGPSGIPPLIARCLRMRRSTCNPKPQQRPARMTLGTGPTTTGMRTSTEAKAAGGKARANEKEKARVEASASGGLARLSEKARAKAARAFEKALRTNAKAKERARVPLEENAPPLSLPMLTQAST